MFLTCPANAKINLFLDITGRRPDGYHLLDTVFCTVGLADEIGMELLPEASGISVSMTPDAGLPEQANLVWRAADLLLRQSAAAQRMAELGWRGLRISVEKRIPAAAGLGGGSADAACVLRMLNQALGEPLSADELPRLGLSLGADVPFMLRAGGVAHGRQLGEALEPLPDMPECAILLVNTGERVSTAEAFAMWNRGEHPADTLRTADGTVHALETGDIALIGKSLYNVFEGVTLPACPKSRAVLSELRKDNCAFGTGMSGSGATLFALFADTDKEYAARLADYCRIKGYFAQVARPVETTLASVVS